MTQGVPRLNELIDMSVKIRTPSVHINFRKPYASHEHMARSLALGIENTFLSQVVLTSEVVCNSEGTQVTGTDAELVELYEALRDASDPTGSDYVIRFVLDRSKLCRKELSVDDVGNAVAEYLGCNGVVIWSEVNMLQWCVRVRVLNLELGDSGDVSLRMMYLIHDFLLDNVPIHGVSGIQRVILRSDTICVPNSDTGGLDSEKIWSADTEGRNLADILALEGVHAPTTFSNDIHETLEVHGVEAATHRLLPEI